MQAWTNFIQASQQVIDPILFSILTQSTYGQFDVEKKIVHIITLKKFNMFQDLFIEHKLQYQPLLERFFGLHAVLFVSFEQESVPKTIEDQKRVESPRPVIEKKEAVYHSAKFDISDVKKWKLAHTLLKHLGGTMREIIKDNHEPDA